MSFEITGSVHKIFDTEQKTQSFQAREFVITTKDGQYEQFVKFQLTQDRCSLLDDYNEGEEIKVHFDLRGREWNGKYFTNLNAWRLEKVSTAEGVTDVSDTPDAFADFPSNAEQAPDDPFSDDLPF